MERSHNVACTRCLIQLCKQDKWHQTHTNVLSPQHITTPANTACHSWLIHSFIQAQHQILRSFSIFELYSTHCSHHGSVCLTSDSWLIWLQKICTSSSFSLIALKTTSLASFSMLQYLLLLHSLLFLHITVCASLFLHIASYTSSFHHHASPLLLPLFMLHTTSHAFKTPSLTWPHKFCTPTSTNFITSSSNRFLIFTFFNQLIFLILAHVFLIAFLTSFIFIPATTKAWWNSPGIPFTFHINRRYSFLSTQSQFFLIFSHCDGKKTLNHTK